MAPLFRNFFILTLSLAFFNPMRAQQLCEGSLGENIFEDGNFGRGAANVVPTNPMLAPGYTYTINPPPDDGLYTITNNTALWSNIFDAWLRIQDNSTDPQGYMMVVNASFEPGIFYEKTIDGLCDNTLYEFSADVINLIRPGVAGHIQPNVDFLLDDEVKYSTGQVAQDGKWKKYGFTFSLQPGQTAVKLTLINNAPGGIGNDLALDNISFQPCGPSTFIDTDTLIFLCEEENQPAKLTANLDIDDYAIQWQQSLDMGMNWEDIPGASGQDYFHAIFDAGVYYYRYLGAGTAENLANARCRTISDWVIIEVLPLRYQVLDTLCTGFTYDFNGDQISESGMYIDTFISSHGCDSIVFLDLAEVPEIPIVPDFTVLDPNCHNFSDGIIEAEDIEGGYPPYVFILDTVQTANGYFDGLSPGTYGLQVADRHGCLFTDQISLNNPPVFTIFLPPDTTVLLGSDIEIGHTATQPSASLLWTPNLYLDCTSCPEVRSLPENDILYYLTGENASGCNSIDSIHIRVNKSDLPIYIPNIFSPNGDGINDTFQAYARGSLISAIEEMLIFDRWGAVIFSLNSTSSLADEVSWDGKKNGEVLPAGVYVYYISLRLLDGSVFPLSGDITLVR